MAGSVREVTAYGGAVDWEPGDSSGGPPTDPSVAARLERAAANARLQAFAAGDPSRDPAATGVDFDQRRQAPLDSAVLFLKQAGDLDGVDSRDVRQGPLGDCHLLVALAAIAGTPAGRAFLRNAIVENKDEKGNVVSYTVTLHDIQDHWFGVSTAHDVPVTVDRLYLEGHAAPRPGSGPTEVWPLVMEKACAKYLGGYNKLGNGGQPSDAMRLLTGCESTSISLDWPERWGNSYSVANLKADLASGTFVILSTRGELPDDADVGPAKTGRPESGATHGLVAGHAYFVKRLEERDGKTQVVLGNPWGHSDPDPIPFEKLTNYFTAIHRGFLP